jgi:type I restriction enzyme S subunit
MAIEFDRDGPWELPEGWVWASLRLFLKARGESVDPSRTPDREFTLYSVPSFDCGFPETVLGKEIGSAKQRVSAGNVLLCKINPRINRSWVVGSHNGDVLASTEWIILYGHDAIEPRYLQLLLRQERVRVFLASNVSGVGGSLMRVKSSTIADFLVPIAPLPEQRRIVARIDELFTEIADGEVLLARARDDLGTWRRALLKAAVTGELTREWRKRNRSNETGIDVLTRVAKVRIGYKTTKTRGRNLVVEELEDDALPAIPDSWAWSRLGDIGDVVGGVTVDKKRRPTHPATVPYLRVANVQRGHLDLSEIKTITVEQSAAASLRLEPRDILLNEGGDRDKIGRGWIWSGEIENCIHQNHVFRVRLFDRSLNPFFISHYANEMGRRFFVEKGKQTTNLASISLSKISQLPVPIPPTAEMNEAIRLLDEMLAITTDVEVELVAASISEAGRQSILKSAFEGRLVEQDPRDEPADRLLVRLGEQADALIQARRTIRKRRPALAAE